MEGGKEACLRGLCAGPELQFPISQRICRAAPPLPQGAQAGQLSICHCCSVFLQQDRGPAQDGSKGDRLLNRSSVSAPFRRRNGPDTPGGSPCDLADGQLVPPAHEAVCRTAVRGVHPSLGQEQLQIRRSPPVLMSIDGMVTPVLPRPAAQSPRISESQ